MQHYSDVVPGSTPFQSLPVIAVKQRVSLNHEKKRVAESNSVPVLEYRTVLSSSSHANLISGNLVK